MGIMLNDQGGRSQLQERLAAELKEKLASSGNGSNKKNDIDETLQKSPNFVNESEYIKHFQKKPRSENNRVIILIVVCTVLIALFGFILILI